MRNKPTAIILVILHYIVFMTLFSSAVTCTRLLSSTSESHLELFSLDYLSVWRQSSFRPLSNVSLLTFHFIVSSAWHLPRRELR